MAHTNNRSQVHARLVEWARIERVTLENDRADPSAYMFYVDGLPDDFGNLGVVYLQESPEEQRTARGLAILAHELGHHRGCMENPASWDQDLIDLVSEHQVWLRRGQERGEPRPRPLTRVEKATTITEERQAWNYAREILAEAGFSDWDEFQRQCDEDLPTYEQLPREDCK